MEENQIHIPEGWKLTSFGEKELFRIIGSGIKHFYAEKEYYSTSSIDGNKVLFAEQLITYRNRPSRANMQPIENSVWFAKMKNTFKILKATKREIEEVILSTGFCGIESTIVDCDYLMQILSSAEFNSQKNLLAEGSTQEAVNNTKIRGIRFLLPNNKTEQTQIATILSKVDEAITQTEQLIAKYTRIKTGLMQDLLTKGIDENGNIRSEETHEFKDSPLGRIPKEWECLSIGDIAERLRSGVTPKGGSDVYQKEGIMLIRSQNVYSYGFKLDDIAYISEEINSRMLGSQLQTFDVLLNITGASIGRSTFVPENHPLSNVNQHVCSIRLKETSLEKAIYVSTFLNSVYGQNQIQQNNAGSNREGINYNQIRAILIPWFKREDEFENFKNIITKTNDKITALQIQLSKLQSLKTGLMQDLLSGKVRVNHLIKETANL